MTPTTAKPNKFFQIPNDKNTSSEKEFVNQYKDEIVELILTQKASVKSSAKMDAAHITEHSIVRSLPTLISVDFKEDFGIIGIYE
jgi:hypothetical protein